MTAENEATTIADKLETMTAPTILQLPRPPQIPQIPQDLVANPVVMVEDKAGIIMW